MTDTPAPDDEPTDEPDVTADEPPDDVAPPTADGGAESADSSAAERAAAAAESPALGGYLNKAAVVVLALFALVAALRFYLAASNAISTWVVPEYRSLFQAAFNLAILLLAIAGIGWQLRRMGEE